MGEKDEDRLLWEDFYTYFIKTWVTGTFKPKLWNVFHILNANIGPALVNRTNNALENYNGRLARRFPNTNKPTMKEFVTQIRDDGCRNAHKYKETLAGNRAVQAREPPNIPKIPDDYPRLT